MKRTHAFTLIELLVVISIMILAMSFLGVSMTRVDKDAAVKAAADGLAGLMVQTRNAAMASQNPYAIAFNIQNHPDSNGRVLNNRSGGHWYRVLGPTRRDRTQKQSGVGRQLPLPIPCNQLFSVANPPINPTFPHFLELVKDSWVSEPYHLPAGKVRFLALSETDEGARINSRAQDGGYWTDRAYAYPSTYPRPYFGYFNAAEGRLYPWGGFDAALSAADPWTRITSTGDQPRTNYTGFFYQGSAAAFANCRNPDDRIYQVDWNQDKDFGDNHPVFGTEASYAIWRKDEPRPLINADWLDFCLVFLPTGEVAGTPFGMGRKRFNNVQAAADYVSATNIADVVMANGVFDMTRAWVGADGFDPGKWSKASPSYFERPDNDGKFMDGSEFGFFDRHLGGWHITLAPDALDDTDTYDSATAAMRSLNPIYRIFISRGGEVEVFKVAMRDDGHLSQGTVFPTSPGYFLAKTSGGAYGNDAKHMGNNFKHGYLHFNRPATGSVDWDTGSDNKSCFLAPRGRPISRVLSPRMLTDKIWWFE
ncbi:MAG TPA: hypothetical protein DCS97_03545 [Planctomycetes bacterium]|nr:hypothetical protein [Planctomycetota bacterium]